METLSGNKVKQTAANLQLLQKYIAELLAQNDSPFSQHILNCSKLAYNLLLKNQFDPQSALACLALPAIYEKNCDWQKIEQLTSKSVVSILKAYQMMRPIAEDIPHQQKLAESIRQLLVAVATDFKVVFVKIGYWYAELKLINTLPKEQANILAENTLQIYAPIAHRLGLYLIKREMEKISFHWQNPKIYDEIADYLDKKLVANQDFYDRLKSRFALILSPAGIKYKFSYRIKDVYSIYKKSKEQKLAYQQLYDLFACRLVLENTQDCYRVLGLVHSAFNPIDGRFKDYINQPKPNGYQSLHTTVADASGTIFEIQIRSKTMHRMVEYGLAAHWHHKEGTQVSYDNLEQVTWIRKLLDNFQDSTDFVHNLQLLEHELYSNNIYVFTPQGKMIKLPLDASVLDFAYAIHSEIGHHCAGAKIDGRFSSLRTQLKNGQQVEVITNSNTQPNTGWLKICRTSRAQQLIRQNLKQQSALDGIKLGQKLLNKVLAPIKLSADKIEQNPQLLKFIKKRSLNSYQELLRAIGTGGIDPREVAVYLAPPKVLKPSEKIKRIIKHPFDFARRDKYSATTLVNNLKDIPTRIALCCEPTRGDLLTGVISNAGLIKVHRSDCPNAMAPKAEESQLLALNWDDKIEQSLNVDLLFECQNKASSLNQITKVLSDMNIEMKRATTEVLPVGRLRFLVMLDLTTPKLIEKIKKRLKKYPDITIKSVHM